MNTRVLLRMVICKVKALSKILTVKSTQVFGIITKGRDKAHKNLRTAMNIPVSLRIVKSKVKERSNMRTAIYRWALGSKTSLLVKVK